MSEVEGVEERSASQPDAVAAHGDSSTADNSTLPLSTQPTSTSTPTSPIRMDIVRGILATYSGLSRGELADQRWCLSGTRLGLALIGMAPVALVAFSYIWFDDDLGQKRYTVGIVFANLLQLLGALSLFRCNLWKASMIPDPRFQSDRIHMILIMGPIQRTDVGTRVEGLSLQQWKRLCLGQILTYTSIYICMMGWIYLNFSLALDDTPKCSEPENGVRHCNDDSYIFTFFLLSLPSIFWYFLIRTCHKRCFSSSQNNINVDRLHQYSTVGTNDAPLEHDENGDEESPRHPTTTIELS